MISFAFQSGGDVRLSVTQDGTPALQASQVYAVFGGNNTAGERSVAAALTAHGSGRYDFESENFVAATIQSGGNHGGFRTEPGEHIVAISVAENQRGEIRTVGVAAQLTSGGGKPGQGYPAVMTVALRGRDGGATAELGGEQATALRASQGGGDKPHVFVPSVGETLGTESYSPSKSSSGQMVDFSIGSQFGVRRLTPRECERLQGFGDNWTAWGIDEQGQRVEMSDSVRYRMLGNAVNRKVSAWLDSQIVRFT